MLVKPRVKYIQSLGQKKFRKQERLFIAEGPKLVKELLEINPLQVKEVYALQNWIDENRQILSKTTVIEINAIELERISQLSTPNNVLALVKQFEIINPVLAKGKITLVLDDIQDPGNLGTIIRIADWFGVDQIICSEDSAELYNPKVVQSTMGSIARVNVFYTNLEEWLIMQGGTNIYAATLEGKDITGMEKLKEAVIILGNESKGIKPSLIQLAKHTITIPRKGKAESLNAAIAAGIILSHLSR